MITFQNTGISSELTKSGRTLIYTDIIRNGETYHWAMYVPTLTDQTLSEYLTANASIYEQDIIRKEALWATVPHTEVITDMTGNSVTVNIPKSMVVCATIPDYEETISDPSFDLKAIKRLLIQLTSSLLASETLTQTQIDDLAVINDKYQVGKAYALNDVFNHEGKLYKVVQSHTSQADWLPGSTPALYTAYVPAGTIADWVQPTGAQDAYMTGDKVKFEGHTYQSLIDNNVWSPTAYPSGWKQL